NEIDIFINSYSLPLNLSLYLALYKIICENSNTLVDVDSLSELINESSYSIKSLGIDDINIDQSFKINYSTFLIKKFETHDLDDIGKFNKLYNFIETNIPNIVQQIRLISALTDFKDILPLNAYLFIYSKPESELALEDLISKLKLYSIIVNGKIIHKPVTVSNITYQNLDVSFNNNFVQYRQFDDIASLLSQFNSESRLLSKFLILYQILENFEIKHDVVKEMGRGGQFKVSDFTKLVNSSPSNEKKYLKKLLKELLDLNILEIGRTDSILELIKETWDTNISGNVNFTYLNNQLKQTGYDNVNILCFDTQVRNLNKDNILNFLTESIYMTRCSIVHYKTHEFHLNDVKLDDMDEFKIFLKDFLVPLLHKIISISIFSDNSPVIYPDNKLTLF
ncbi:hypothetical protein OK932_10280, partial [Streptococcus pneumoniae]|nr:hypothetical protein [Streptococcus pneumoniae]